MQHIPHKTQFPASPGSQLWGSFQSYIYRRKKWPLKSLWATSSTKVHGKFKPQSYYFMAWVADHLSEPQFPLLQSLNDSQSCLQAEHVHDTGQHSNRSYCFTEPRYLCHTCIQGWLTWWQNFRYFRRKVKIRKKTQKLFLTWCYSGQMERESLKSRILLPSYWNSLLCPPE